MESIVFCCFFVKLQFMYWLKFRAEKVRVLKKPIAANYVFVIKDLMITCQCITNGRNKTDFSHMEARHFICIWPINVAYLGNIRRREKVTVVFRTMHARHNSYTLSVVPILDYQCRLKKQFMQWLNPSLRTSDIWRYFWLKSFKSYQTNAGLKCKPRSMINLNWILHLFHFLQSCNIL